MNNWNITELCGTTKNTKTLTMIFLEECSAQNIEIIKTGNVTVDMVDDSISISNFVFGYNNGQAIDLMRLLISTKTKWLENNVSLP